MPLFCCCDIANANHECVWMLLAARYSITEIVGIMAHLMNHITISVMVYMAQLKIHRCKAFHSAVKVICPKNACTFCAQIKYWFWIKKFDHISSGIRQARLYPCGGQQFVVSIKSWEKLWLRPEWSEPMRCTICIHSGRECILPKHYSQMARSPCWRLSHSPCIHNTHTIFFCFLTHSLRHPQFLS